MNILITNDDSIFSPGIAALAKVARQFGDVRIVAPDVEQSSMGQAISSEKPLSYRTAPITFDGIEAYRVNGTPSDCVALGTHLWARTDLVLSGINMGYNVGNSLWHSGTLAAAKQAVLLGIRGIAFSTTTEKGAPDFELLAPFIADTIKLLLQHPDMLLVNVNLPRTPQSIYWTSQAVRQYDGRIVPGIDPVGRKHYWFTFVPMEPAEEGTDRWAVDRNFVSITPLRMDLTDDAALLHIRKKQPAQIG